MRAGNLPAGYITGGEQQMLRYAGQERTKVQLLRAVVQALWCAQACLALCWRRGPPWLVCMHDGRPLQEACSSAVQWSEDVAQADPCF